MRSLLVELVVLHCLFYLVFIFCLLFISLVAFSIRFLSDVSRISFPMSFLKSTVSDCVKEIPLFLHICFDGIFSIFSCLFLLLHLVVVIH